MTEGIIVSYDLEKGSGFVRPDDDDDKFAFDADEEHRDQFNVGDRVRFNVEGGMAGMMATDVQRIGPTHKSVPRS